MIIVEAGHAHVMKFLPLSCELSIYVAVTHFLGEKWGNENFVNFFKLTVGSKNIELFCTQFNSRV
jgi:hypothetical protein